MSVDAKAIDQPVIEEEAEEGSGVNRREFLNYAWLASLGIVTAQFGGVSYLFAMPRFRAGEFGGVFPLGTADSLPDIGEQPVKNAKGRFWFVRDEEGVYAFYTVCTHLGCLYQWRPTENRFICPCHGSQFSREGEFAAGPAPRDLDTFIIRVVDDEGTVLAETPPGEGPQPTPVPSPNAHILIDTGAKQQGRPK